MDLWDLTKLLFRRWMISAPILLVSVVLLLVASQTVKPDFRATGHVIIVSPAQTTKQVADASPNKVHNPWEDLGFRALAQTAILKVQSKEVLAKMVRDGFSDNITLAVDDRTPVISIEAVGHTPEMAAGTIREVIKNLDDAVTQAQTVYGVQKESLFTAYAIDQGDNVETVTSTRTRALAVIAGVGVLATVALTIIIDAQLRRRSRRRSGRIAADAVVSATAGASSLPAPRRALGRSVGRALPSDEALALTLRGLSNRRSTDGAPSAGAGDTERNGRGVTVDYKRDDGELVGTDASADDDLGDDEPTGKRQAPNRQAIDEAATDSTVVLPLTSLWGDQEPKRGRR